MSDLPTPLQAPPLPQTDLLSFLFDKPATDYDPSTVIFQDDVSDARLTWQDVKSQLRKVGNGLKTKVNVKPGDKVMMLATHGLHYPAIFYGILCAGAVVVPVNPTLLVSDIDKYISSTGSRAMFVGPQFISVARKLREKYTDLNIIELDPANTSAPGHLSYKDFFKLEEIDWPRGPKVNQSTALICFSSGTSGLPKGCMLSHANIVGNQHIHYHGLRPANPVREINVGAFPPFHVAGIFSSMTNPLYRGDMQVIMKSFNLQAYLDLIVKYQPTELSMAPPVVLILATSPLVDKVSFASVKKIGVGAAPLTKELSDKCLNRLRKQGATDIKMMQVWGMTEGVCCLTGYKVDDDESIAKGGVGYTLPHLSIKLVDPESSDDKVVAIGERGEILVKGCSIFQGYIGLNNADYFSKDGYYRTGDVGISDAQGRLSIVDRIKELIKVSGFQVAPAELEGILLTHPDIDDAAVIGIPAPNGVSERPRAYLVLRPGSRIVQQHPELSRKQIHSWLNAQVVNYKRLTGGIKILRADRGEVVPKSLSGKILRRVLRDQAAQEQSVVTAAKL